MTETIIEHRSLRYNDDHDDDDNNNYNNNNDDDDNNNDNDHNGDDDDDDDNDNNNFQLFGTVSVDLSCSLPMGMLRSGVQTLPGYPGVAGYKYLRPEKATSNTWVQPTQGRQSDGQTHGLYYSGLAWHYAGIHLVCWRVLPPLPQIVWYEIASDYYIKCKTISKLHIYI